MFTRQLGFEVFLPRCCALCSAIHRPSYSGVTVRISMPHGRLRRAKLNNSELVGRREWGMWEGGGRSQRSRSLSLSLCLSLLRPLPDRLLARAGVCDQDTPCSASGAHLPTKPVSGSWMDCRSTCLLLFSFCGSRYNVKIPMP